MKTVFIIFFIIIGQVLYGQNVGIGTNTPTEKLEVKNPDNSTVKISSTSFSDTSQLILSNRSGTTGTDFFFQNKEEEALFIGSSSDLVNNTSSNSLVITPQGNTGLGITPSTRLDVNGGVKVRGLNIFEMGANIAGKEVNAGKIAYNGFGKNALTFVGAGTNINNRAVYFFAEGGTGFGGPVDIEGQIKLFGNSGTNGQVLTSTGSSSAPVWKDAAYSNNIRFSYNLSKSSSSYNDSLNFEAAYNYNLNPSQVYIQPGNTHRLVIAKAGLYHFNGSLSMTHHLSGPDEQGLPNASISYYINNKQFVVESDFAHSLAILPDNNFVRTFPFSFDVYLSAGQTIKFYASIFGYGGGSHTKSGYVHGYLISE
ncbi:MAG TPA: hypothetical protein PK504_08825 [Ferruginibacter sp.]|nr:hypothetical protein [Ferruginibacter sp.]HRE63291.1 hypothetical protein [Ferruginibacter sp.]